MRPADARQVVAELRAATGSMALDFPELALHDDGTITWGRTTPETAHRFLDLLALLDATREAEAASWPGSSAATRGCATACTPTADDRRRTPPPGLGPRPAPHRPALTCVTHMRASS